MNGVVDDPAPEGLYTLNYKATYQKAEQDEPKEIDDVTAEKMFYDVGIYKIIEFHQEMSPELIRSLIKALRSC